MAEKDNVERFIDAWTGYLGWLVACTLGTMLVAGVPMVLLGVDDPSQELALIVLGSYTLLLAYLTTFKGGAP